MTKSYIEKYNDLNNNFKKTMIFKVGANSGFFSELNMMIFAILYCLENDIKFVLYSDDANFANTKGWEEFFLPFVEENHDDFHKKYNYRFSSKKNKNLIRKNQFIIKNYKKRHNVDFLTYEIFKFINNNLDFAENQFDIKELDIKGNSFEAARPLAEMVYRFNDETKLLINKTTEELYLPKDYVAIHIRAGDIETEIAFRKQNLLEIDAYIEKIEKIDRNIQNVFVFTDDYRQIKSLKAKRPEWNIYTLCNEDENGFVYKDFNITTWEVKKKGLIKLFTNIDICKNSQFFVGTYTSNPDWFLNMIMPKEKLYFADCEEIEWQTVRDKKGLLSQYAYVPADSTSSKENEIKNKFKTIYTKVMTICKKGEM